MLQFGHRQLDGSGGIRRRDDRRDRFPLIHERDRVRVKCSLNRRQRDQQERECAVTRSHLNLPKGVGLTILDLCGSWFWAHFTLRLQSAAGGPSVLTYGLRQSNSLTSVTGLAQRSIEGMWTTAKAVWTG